MSLPIQSLKVLQGKILDWTLKISLNQLYSLNLYFLVLLKDVGVKPIVTSSEVIDLIEYALKKGSNAPQAYSLCCGNCTTLDSVKQIDY